jgi:hypothetical protein
MYNVPVGIKIRYLLYLFLFLFFCDTLTLRQATSFGNVKEEWHSAIGAGCEFNKPDSSPLSLNA